MKIKWIEIRHPIGPSSYAATINGIKIAGYHLNPATAKWKGNIYLPQNSGAEYYESDSHKEIRKMLEEKIKNWFYKILKESSKHDTQKVKK